MAKENINRNVKDRRGSVAIKESEYFFYILLIAFVVLMAPHLIRFASGNTTLIGAQPYLHARIAEGMDWANIADTRFVDDLILGGRLIQYNPYHYLLAVSGHLFTVTTASKMLPFVFGLLTITFFYFTLKSLGIKSLNRFILSVLLVLSPPFIYLFSVSTPSSMSISLTMLGLYLYLSDKKYALGASLFCFFIVSFFSFFNLLLIILVILVISLIMGTKREKMLFFVLSILVIYLFKPVAFYNSFDYQAVSLRDIVSDLGAQIGFGVFNLILAFIGLFYSWKSKEKLYPLYFAVALLFAATFFIGREANAYSNFFLILFAGIGLLRIKELEWRFLQLRDITFMIIACGLLFSSISYTIRLSNAEPSEDVFKSLEFLEKNSDEGALVFTHYSRGYWVETIARRPVLADSLFYTIPDFNKRQLYSQDLFRSNSLDETRVVLGRYNISYIWIDKSMKEGLVWHEEKEGLLFLLRNEETFKKVYSSNETEIFKVQGLN